jgi:NAD(P)-dependent dehydrogenase (short-subunit alcohol dehydrogenase family)
MKYEIPQMLRQGSGSIVNTASAGGLIGTPGLAAYTASKHGVVGLTKTAALEYVQQGIRINAVCPGTVTTPMVKSSIDAFPELEKILLTTTYTGVCKSRITTQFYRCLRTGLPM